MGVHGLWDLLEIVGNRKNIESCTEKRVAVDASVWLGQFLKAMRDERGEVIQNAHVYGFFTRICRLLFNRIHPVFVFDGSTPALKRQTTAARRRRREEKASRAQKVAQKLFANQIRQRELEQALTGQRESQPGQLATERQSSQEGDDGPGEEEALEREEGERHEVEEEEWQDMEEEKMDEALDLDAIVATGNELDPEVLQGLPPSTALQLVEKMREYNFSATRSKLQKVSDAPDRFSSEQIKAYLQGTKAKRKWNEALKNVGKGEGDNNNEEVQPKRIEADKNREYLFVSTQDALMNQLHPSEAQPKKPAPEGASGRKRKSKQGEFSLNFLNPSKEKEFKLESSKLHAKLPKPLQGKVLEESITSSANASETHDREGDGTNEAIEISIDMTLPQGFGPTADEQTHEEEEEEWEDVAPAAPSQDNEGRAKVPTRKQVYSKSHGFHFGRNLDAWEGSDANGVDQEQQAAELNRILDQDKDQDGEQLHEQNGRVQGEKAEPTSVCGGNLETQMADEPSLSPSFQARPLEHSAEKGERRKESIHINDESQRATSSYASQFTPPREKNDSSTAAERQLIRGETTAPAECAEESHPVESDLIGEHDHPLREGGQKAAPASSLDTSHRVQWTPTGKCDSRISEEKGAKPRAAAVENSYSAEGNATDQHAYPLAEAECQKLSAELEESQQHNSENPFQRGLEMEPRNSRQEATPEEMPATSTVRDRTDQENVGTARPSQDGNDQETMDRIRSEVEELEEQRKKMEAQIRKQARYAEEPTQEMLEECQELLEMFGIPYQIAPEEAEAQCAYMESENLVDAVVTDDSDAFLFGARNVYRHMFDSKRYMEEYKMDAVEHELNMGREQFILLALSLGSDYTAGIEGVGVVNAMELVSAFRTVDDLKAFKQWFDTPASEVFFSSRETAEAAAQQYGFDDRQIDFLCSSAKRVKKHWVLPDEFPNERVVSAYTKPTVDRSKENFDWGKPDVDMLRIFCKEKFGWNDERTEKTLQDVLKQWELQQRQRLMTDYFTASFNQRFAKVGSKRLRRAMERFAGENANRLSLETAKEDGESSRSMRKNSRRTSGDGEDDEHGHNSHVRVIDDEDDDDGGK